MLSTVKCLNGKRRVETWTSFQASEYGPGPDRGLLAALGHGFAEVSVARRVVGAGVSKCVEFSNVLF